MMTMNTKPPPRPYRPPSVEPSSPPSGGVGGELSKSLGFRVCGAMMPLHRCVLRLNLRRICTVSREKQKKEGTVLCLMFCNMCVYWSTKDSTLVVEEDLRYVLHRYGVAYPQEVLLVKFLVVAVMSSFQQ